MDFKFRDDLGEDFCLWTDDFWYDLFEGGYIDPRKVLADESQIEAVENAIKVLQDFRIDLENSELLDYE